MSGNNKKSYTETTPTIPCLPTLIAYKHQYAFVLMGNARAALALQRLIDLGVKRARGGQSEATPLVPTRDESSWWDIFHEAVVHSVDTNRADDKPVSARLAAHSGMYRDMRGLDEEPENRVLDPNMLRICNVVDSPVTRDTLRNVIWPGYKVTFEDKDAFVEQLPRWMHNMITFNEDMKRGSDSLKDKMSNLRDRMKINEWVYEQRKGL